MDGRRRGKARIDVKHLGAITKNEHVGVGWELGYSGTVGAAEGVWGGRGGGVPEVCIKKVTGVEEDKLHAIYTGATLVQLKGTDDIEKEWGQRKRESKKESV